MIVEGTDPVGTAVALGHLPGTAWIAVGLAFNSMKDVAPAAGRIAMRYLTRGDRFVVIGEGTGGAPGADVAGAVTSGILDAVRGARVSEAARVRFRAAQDGGGGVVGVEIIEGPGGSSTGETWVNCLASGGAHSSVLAWYALLMGYRVRIIHMRTVESALIAVARLYAELSHRVGPGSLKLEVVEGGGEALAQHLDGTGGVFGGFRPTSKPVPRALLKAVSAPLYLMPEEMFVSQFESLGVKADDSEAGWCELGGTELRVNAFDSWAEDISAVLDGLR